MTPLRDGLIRRTRSPLAVTSLIWSRLLSVPLLRTRPCYLTLKVLCLSISRLCRVASKWARRVAAIMAIVAKTT